MEIGAAGHWHSAITRLIPGNGVHSSHLGRFLGQTRGFVNKRFSTVYSFPQGSTPSPPDAHGCTTSCCTRNSPFLIFYHSVSGKNFSKFFSRPFCHERRFKRGSHCRVTVKVPNLTSFVGVHFAEIFTRFVLISTWLTFSSTFLRLRWPVK